MSDTVPRYSPLGTVLVQKNRAQNLPLYFSKIDCKTFLSSLLRVHTHTHSAFGKSLCTSATVQSSWNVMAHGDAREGKFGKSLCTSATVQSSWNVMAHGDAREGKFGKSLCTYKRCWKWRLLPSPVSPFTCPPVRHHVLSLFNWTLP